ncbi:MAG: hypothetical protein B6I26_06250 [Desulfobacteraceae bacterium 4572_130]|nr:MAG: hypothetical protein B6I26_06250 [Desulfobacteraceae bacterium 4572_130]
MNELIPIPWKIIDITRALNIKTFPGKINYNFVFSGISIDSRFIKSNELFVALKGEIFDGHSFVYNLVKKGIKGFVLEKKFLKSLTKDQNIFFKTNNCILFFVENTLKALGRLAKFQRIRSKVKVVAITGSNGKTSTKEMVGRIFETKFNTLVTKGNFNNEIGLPLTLLKLSNEHEWAVVEMGMNHFGEIARLSDISMPDIGIITNICNAHLKGLGSIFDVANAKAELVEFIQNQGSLILNYSDSQKKIFIKKAEKNKNIKDLIFFGVSENAHIKAKTVKIYQEKIYFKLFIGKNKSTKNKLIDVCINTPGLFMVENGLAAAAAGFQAGISLNDIKKGLEAFVPVPGRINILKELKYIKIIDDTYNANPESVESALKTLKNLSGKDNSIAVLGDMLELGSMAKYFHYQIGKKAGALGVSRLYAYGDMAEHIINGALYKGLDKDKVMMGTQKKIADNIMKKVNSRTWVLVKGSRGMKMEDIISRLKGQN